MTATAVAGAHRLAAPTVADFREAVLQSGGNTSLWIRLCTHAGVPAAALTLSLGQLDALAQKMKAEPGVLGLMGRSLGIRVVTYRSISPNGADR